MWSRHGPAWVFWVPNSSSLGRYHCRDRSPYQAKRNTCLKSDSCAWRATAAITWNSLICCTPVRIPQGESISDYRWWNSSIALLPWSGYIVNSTPAGVCPWWQSWWGAPCLCGVGGQRAGFCAGWKWAWAREGWGLVLRSGDRPQNLVESAAIDCGPGRGGR